MQVYADNAATTKPSKAAVDAMSRCLTQTYGNPSSLHQIGQTASQALMQARQEIAESLGCSAKEIYFTSGGSEADNWALRSAAYAGAKVGKKHILSTAIEHHAILHTLEQLEQEGFSVTLLPVSPTGLVTASQVAAAIRPETCLVSVMTANNEIGTLEPIAEIGAVCREKGVPFHTDAVQAVGHLPLHLAKLPVDMLSLSAHKFHGPKGTGLLFARKGTELRSFLCGGAQERGKRAGTENLPAIVGMAAALQEETAHLDEHLAYVTALRNRLIAGLEKIPRCILNGEREARLAGNANFCFEGIAAESLLVLLDTKGICVSSGSACASGSIDPSHVLTAIGRTPEQAYSAVRFSLSAENTAEEVDYLIETVTASVARLRRLSPKWKG